MFLRTERSVKDFLTFYPVVSTLVIINLLLWIFTGFFQTELGTKTFFYGAGNNVFISNGEYWRLFTPIFLHANFMHVVFNCFSLILFGPALEQMIGKWKFIFAYMAAGLVGNIGTYVIDPTSPTFHIGASGAIYGLFGMYVYMMFMRKDLIDEANARLVVIILAIGVVMTFANPMINTGAHLFGLLGGVFVAPLVLQKAQPFSIWRNISKKQRRQTDDGSPQFNPDRWKRRRPRTQKEKERLIWIAIIAFVVIMFVRTIVFG